MAKRTGLGRGIGALIPTSEPNESRPVDVFFPDNNASNKAAEAAEAAAVATQEDAPAPAKPATRKPAARKPAAKAPKAAEKPAQADEELVPVPGLTLIQVDPHSIVPNPRQPRTVFDAEDLAELVHSVREFGVLQPVVVRTAPGGSGYELIMGERRTRAAREAGLATIPAIVRETDDVDLLRDALLENLHRSELNPLEEASAYQQLLDDFGITHEELATRIGRSRPQVSNTLRLLKLPVAVQQRVAAGVLSAGHARAILSLDSPEAMSRLADKIVNEDLSVRAAESAAKTIEGSTGRATKPQAGARRAFLDDVATRLGDRLNTRVKIALGARKGQVSIEFASIQDLNRILGELGEDEFGAAK